jgi:hypothetical protein
MLTEPEPDQYVPCTFYGPEALRAWLNSEAARAGLTFSAYCRSHFTRTRERQEATKT